MRKEEIYKLKDLINSLDIKISVDKFPLQGAKKLGTLDIPFLRLSHYLNIQISADTIIIFAAYVEVR